MQMKTLRQQMQMDNVHVIDLQRTIFQQVFQHLRMKRHSMQQAR